MELRLPEPEAFGFADVAGVQIAWQSFGHGESAVLVVPTWNFVDSRVSASLVRDLSLWLSLRPERGQIRARVPHLPDPGRARWLPNEGATARSPRCRLDDEFAPCMGSTLGEFGAIKRRAGWLIGPGPLSLQMLYGANEQG